ncbi:MAG: ThuA domain-containing protein [Candidatus Latescibacterota bacterium]
MESSRQSRRAALRSGFAALAAGTVIAPDAFSAPKLPGETRVLLLVGDYWHNGVAQESHWRGVLGPTGWRLLFAQSSQFVTPEALAKTDLFISARYAGPDSLGFITDGIVEDRPAPAPWMTDAQENALVENVRNRGMGLLNMHCSIWNPERKKYMELLGVEKPLMHGPVQRVGIHDINQTHPISKGIKDFEIDLDENFGSELVAGKSTLLYKSTGRQDKRTDNAAWCREDGKGRVVSLLFGHVPQPFHRPEVKTLMWRSAFWAMRRDLPPSDFKMGY